jgi:hypothetical protein
MPDEMTLIECTTKDLEGFSLMRLAIANLAGKKLGK